MSKDHPSYTERIRLGWATSLHPQMWVKALASTTYTCAKRLMLQCPHREAMKSQKDGTDFSHMPSRSLPQHSPEMHENPLQDRKVAEGPLSPSQLCAAAWAGAVLEGPAHSHEVSCCAHS